MVLRRHRVNAKVSKTEKNLHFSSGEGDGNLILSLYFVLYFRIDIERSYLSRCFKQFDLLQLLLNSDEDCILPSVECFLCWYAI